VVMDAVDRSKHGNDSDDVRQETYEWGHWNYFSAKYLAANAAITSPIPVPKPE